MAASSGSGTDPAPSPSSSGRLGQMRSIIKGFGELGRKLSFTSDAPPAVADASPKTSSSGSFMRLLLPNRNPDRYREGFDVVVKIPLKKDPSELDPENPDAGSVDLIDGFGSSSESSDGDAEEEEEEEDDEEDPDHEHDHDDEDEAYADHEEVDEAAYAENAEDHNDQGAARTGPLPLQPTDTLPDGEAKVEGSEPFPDMPMLVVTDEDGGRADPLLGDGELRAEYKRRLSFNVEHERRLTFKRERAQSDVADKRAGVIPAVAAIREEARRASGSPDRTSSAGPQESSADAGRASNDKHAELSKLRRAPSSPSPAVFQPPGQLRRAQSMIRASSHEVRPILKARNRDWLDNPKVYKGTGGSLDVQLTGVVERLRDDWRNSPSARALATATPAPAATTTAATAAAGAGAAPPPAEGRRRRIVFNETVSVIQTFRKTDYIRRPDPNATFLHLNNKVKRVIRQELNEFKREEMLVHEQAFMNTVFH